jgi:hypothetical protein
VVALDDAIARIELLKARVEAMGQRNMRYGRRVGGSSETRTTADHHKNQRQQHEHHQQQQEEIGAAGNKKGSYPSAGDGDVDLVQLINKKDDEGAALRL